MAATATMTEHPASQARNVGWLTTPGAAGGHGARLFDVDADLGRVVPEPLRERLAPLLRVRVETLDVGDWMPAGAPLEPESLGFLVLDGLLLRDLTLERRCCAELLGPGDLLRPWVDDTSGGPEAVSAELAWQVADGPVRVAVLDRRVSHFVCRVPAMVTELLDRVLLRSRALQFQLALTQMHGIDRRLELLLWHLADRWGRVTLDGVILPLGLTHEMLGKLIGARRPSVTTALGRLAERGSVVRFGDAWLLREDARAETA